MDALGQWDLPTVLVMVPFSFAMFMAAKKTTGVPLLFATIQIVALSCLCLFIAWSQFHLVLSPVLLVFFLLTAGLVGRVLRSRAKRDEAERNSAIVLSLKEKELKATHLQLVKQDEADRRILASDLHDQVLNDLKTLSSAVRDLAAGLPEEAAPELEKIKSLIDSTTSQVREVMENLTPSVLENLGLAVAIDDLVRRSAARGKFKARFKDETAGLLRLSKIQELLVFRSVQEALSNIIKHAEATRVEVLMSVADDELAVKIKDDGRGIPEDKVRGGSRGLRYMRQRADLMGACISWQPAQADRLDADGQKYPGCLVVINLPMTERS